MSRAAYLDVGVLRDTLLPSLGFSLSLAVPTYVLARSINYLEAKDWLWSIGQVANAWYAAVGRRVVAGVPIATALSTITRPGWLLLGAATMWGGRLLYRESTRAVARGRDDPRYDEIKQSPNGWNWAFPKFFLGEAIAQSLITLPFTAPFRAVYPVIPSSIESKPYLQALAVGLFGIGFSLELLADYQLGKHQEEKKPGLLREGVWSIVRHPNYLGDILIHSSFPLFLYANDMFNPVTLLGPIANYIFLRFISGDAQNEAFQEARYAKEDPTKKAQFDAYRTDKNAVWPNFSELTNKWSLIVLGVGATVAVVERFVSRI